MVSIKDVAKLAGVSTATISRTLANPETVLEKTRDKVMVAVEKSGYVTNSLARSLRTKRSYSIVVLVPDITNTFFSNIIQGIETVARKNGYRILLGDMQNDESNARGYGELCAQRQADGLICLGRTIPFAFDKRRRSMDPDWPPLVMACEYHDDIPIPGVGIDNRLAALEGVRYLASAGHKRIAYINGPSDSPLCKDRLKGYKQGMRELGQTNTKGLVFRGDFNFDGGALAAHAILKSSQTPTAIFCANDAMAIGALQVLKTQGVRVPQDISLLGFDDIQFSQYCDPPLSSIHQPRTEIGTTSMEMMLELLNGSKNKKNSTASSCIGRSGIESHRIELPHRIVTRDSVTAPNKNRRPCS